MAKGYKRVQRVAEFLGGLIGALRGLKPYLKYNDYFVVYSMLLQFAIKSHNLLP